MRTLAFMFRSSRNRLLWAIFAGLVTGACYTALLALLNLMLYSGLRQSRRAVFAFVALTVVAAGSRLVTELLLGRLSQGCLYDLRLKLSAQILQLPLRRLEELGLHRLYAVLMDDIPAVVGFVSGAPLVVTNIALVCGLLIYMGFLSPRLLAVVCCFILVAAVSYVLPISRARKYFRLGREESDHMQKHYRALLQGIKELKMNARRRQAFMTDVLERTAGRVRRLSIASGDIYAVVSGWSGVFIFLGLALLVFLPQSLTGGRGANFTGYTLALVFLVGPVRLILDTIPAIARLQVSLEKVGRVTEVLDAEAPVVLPSAAAVMTAPRLIELQAVTYSYPGEGGETFILGPIDLAVRPGEVLFLAGGNGSGKTTLAKVMLGLYRPTTGTIRLNGEVVDEGMLEQYQQSFSSVFADFFLFDSLLGIERDRLDGEAQRCLEMLRLQKKVTLRGDTLSTTELSSGQRKRMALLTAWLEDRPVYFFDEWAADQDPVFKAIFYRQIIPALRFRGKTVILISHDHSYYDAGDRIVELESGRIVSERVVSQPCDSTMADLQLS